MTTRPELTSRLLDVAYRFNRIWFADWEPEPLPELCDLDLDDLYREYVAWTVTLSQYHSRDGFNDWLSSRIATPDDVYEIVWCDVCDEPAQDGDDFGHGSVGSICQSCLCNYTYCEGCSEYEEYGGWVNGSYWMCDSCLENSCHWCDQCDEYVDDEHYHDDDCDCEAPHQTFKVRNDGEGFLANDERTRVVLPAGHISDEGVNEITRLLLNSAPPQPDYDYNRAYRQHDMTLTAEERAEAVAYYDDYQNNEHFRWRQLAYGFADALGQQWQTKDGNFTKRLSRYAYKNHALKLPPEVVSQVGNIGSAHSGGVNFEIEVTRNLNLPAEEFAHEDSCWWQSYSSSRCTLKSNGGFGLRTFSESSIYGSGVEGRAWVMPMKRRDDGSLTPTFNTETPDAFVVFNGYGDLQGYSAARIVAHMAGMTYRKVSFSGGEMYVNGDSGYLVAPEEIASNYTDGSINLHLDVHSSLGRTEEIAA